MNGTMTINISRHSKLLCATFATAGLALVGYLGYRIVKHILVKTGCIVRTDNAAKTQLEELSLQADKKFGPEEKKALRDSLYYTDKAFTSFKKIRWILKKISPNTPIGPELERDHPVWIKRLKPLMEVWDSIDRSQYSKVSNRLWMSIREEVLAGVFTYFKTYIDEKKWLHANDVISILNSKTYWPKLRDYLFEIPDSSFTELIQSLNREESLFLLHKLVEDAIVNISTSTYGRFKEICQKLKEFKDVDYLVGLALGVTSREYHPYILNRTKDLLVNLEQTDAVIEAYGRVIDKYIENKEHLIASKWVDYIQSPSHKTLFAIKILENLFSNEEFSCTLTCGILFQFLDENQRKQFEVCLENRKSGKLIKNALKE
jgi:hypothetical protein